MNNKKKVHELTEEELIMKKSEETKTLFWKTVNQLTDEEFWWALPYELSREHIEECFNDFDEVRMEDFIESCKINNMGQTNSRPK